MQLPMCSEHMWVNLALQESRLACWGAECLGGIHLDNGLRSGLPPGLVTYSSLQIKSLISLHPRCLISGMKMIHRCSAAERTKPDDVRAVQWSHSAQWDLCVVAPSNPPYHL